MQRNLLSKIIILGHFYSTVSFELNPNHVFATHQYRVLTYSSFGLKSKRPAYRFCSTLLACKPDCAHTMRYAPIRFKECVDSDNGRQIIIGDVHGCKDELLALLDKLKFNIDCDRLIFVGDLIAKGPDSLGCLSIARSLDAVMVLGNHEVKTMQIVNAKASLHTADFTRSEHATIAKSLLDDRNAKLLDYLKNAPACVSLEKLAVFVVHAGLMPESKPEDNSLTVLTTMRSVVSRDGVSKPSPEAGETPWAALWNGPETVVFGHDAARGLQVFRLIGFHSVCA
jgi:bis(5'-nucleosyl)-tetraphosphatase (symmetrical)